MHNNGFTVLEVLVAWVLLSTVLFAVLLALQDNRHTLESAYYRSLAASQLNAMANLVRATRAAQLAWAVQQWNKQNRHLLPQGSGHVRCLAAHVCDLELSWFARQKNTLKLTITLH